MHESAKAEVDKIMRTEAPLLFPPGQVQFKHQISDSNFPSSSKQSWTSSTPYNCKSNVVSFSFYPKFHDHVTFVP